MWDDENRSLICHKSCYKLLVNKFNYKLKIDDIKNKLNDNSILSNYGKIVNKYVGLQDFPWTAMILNKDSFSNFEMIMVLNKKLKINDNNINFLTDPLKNDKNANRIIKIWSPIIKKLKSTRILKKSRPSPSESGLLGSVP